MLGRCLVLLAALLLGSASGLAADRLPADLAQAARDYDQAQITGNKTELERLLADDYTLVNSGAQIQSKSEFIADSVAPGFKLEPFEVQHAINKVWSEGAVLSGEVLLKGTSEGKPFSAHFRFADIWRKQKGRWQVVFTEVTRITPAAAS